MPYADVTPSQAPAVGAQDENVAWKAGTSPNNEWLAEVQVTPTANNATQGANAILNFLGKSGVAGSAQSCFTACQAIDWLLALQATDGSFPGTGQRSSSSPYPVVYGADFHTVLIATENLGKSTLAVKTQLPGLAASTKANTGPQWLAVQSMLNSKVAAYTTALYKTAQWQLTPDAVAKEVVYNGPFGHKRWMGAASFNYASILNGGVAAFDAAALAHANDGLSRVLGPGWQLAIFPANSDGSFLPGTLVAPGATAPTGTTLVPAEGVDPESFGSDGNPGADSGYQVNNIRYANDYASNLPSGTLPTSVILCSEKKAMWVASRLTSAAAQNSSGHWYAVFHSNNGDSRHGIESTIDGHIKQDSISAYIAMFRGLAKLTADPNMAAYCNALVTWLTTISNLNTSGTVQANGTNIPALPLASAYGLTYPTPPALPPPPDAPAQPTGVAGNTTASWDWPDPPAGCTSNFYQGSLAPVTGLTVSQILLTGLPNGVGVTGAVSYTDSHGQESAKSLATTVTPLAPASTGSAPAAPTNPRIYAFDSRLHPICNSVTGATSYNAYNADDAAPRTPIATGLSLPSKNFTVPNNTTHSYYYTAVNQFGESAPGPTMTATANPPLPLDVSSFFGVGGDGVAILSWGPAPNATSYNLKKGGVVTTGIMTLSQTVALANGASGDFSVCGVNTAGAGPYSDIVTVTAAAAAPPVTMRPVIRVQAKPTGAVAVSSPVAALLPKALALGQDARIATFDKSCDVLRPAPAVDKFSRPVPGAESVAHTYACKLRAGSGNPNETVEVDQPVAVSVWRVFLPPDAEVKDTDRMRVFDLDVSGARAGAGTLFEVTGTNTDESNALGLVVYCKQV